MVMLMINKLTFVVGCVPATVLRTSHPWQDMISKQNCPNSADILFQLFLSVGLFGAFYDAQQHAWVLPTRCQWHTHSQL